MKKEKSFKEIVKEKLTEETINQAWVLKRKNGTRIEFDLKCNRCTQFPKGFYDKAFVNTSKEAKDILYEKLIEQLKNEEK